MPKIDNDDDDDDDDNNGDDDDDDYDVFSSFKRISNTIGTRRSGEGVQSTMMMMIMMMVMM